ncbi:MAG: hypothetical protein JWQ35_285 [Bacteriovoracaceae bacterium]|nr:hypothetical protein [Bacteriovoracaceae bacterium]
MRKIIAVFLSFGITMSSAPLAFSSESTPTSKADALTLIETKSQEVGKAHGFLEQLDKDIALTNEALSKATRTRTRSYFTWGIPAAGLLVLTVLLGASAVVKGSGSDTFGLAAMLRIFAGIAAIVTGAGAAGTGYVVYLRRTDVTKLQILLSKLQTRSDTAKTELAAKKVELDSIKKSVGQN